MTGPAPRNVPTHWTVLILALALATTAISCQPAEGFFVRNSSGQELAISIEGWDSPLATNTIPSGVAVAFLIRGACEGTAVVATTADGRAYARADEPACPDATWILDADGARME